MDFTRRLRECGEGIPAGFGSHCRLGRSATVCPRGKSTHRRNTRRYVLSSQQLDDITAIVRARRPPLVYISKYRDRATYHGGGVFPRTIHELYEPCYENVNGVWYRLKTVDGLHASVSEPVTIQR